MSTPGIEALSRLGCQASGVEFLNVVSDGYGFTYTKRQHVSNLARITHEGPLVTSSMAAKLPVEVWTRIGDFVTSPTDLATLASISPHAMSAAADLARYPWIEEFRLVDVVASGPVPPILAPPIPETMRSTDSKDIRNQFYELFRTKFTAVEGGRRVNVELGLGHVEGDRVTSTGRRQTTFNVLTCFGRLFTIEVYLRELDDDGAQAG
jgi:hypothetical protein